LPAPFREHLAPLTRRGRALARHPLTLRLGLYLSGIISHIYTSHQSRHDVHPAVGMAGVARTPAMAAKVTPQGCTGQELLSLHVPRSRKGNFVAKTYQLHKLKK